jgi:hypothetical protein
LAKLVQVIILIFRLQEDGGFTKTEKSAAFLECISYPHPEAVSSIITADIMSHQNGSHLLIG